MKIFQNIKNLGSNILKWWKKAAVAVKDGLVKAFVYVRDRLAYIFTSIKERWHRIKMPKLRYILLGILGPLLIGGATYAGISFYQLQDPQRVLLDNAIFGEMEFNVDEEFSESIINIAVLGFDQDEERKQAAPWYQGRGLPDVIFVISINFETNDVAFVRILRDSYVPIFNTGVKDKINHSYNIGFDAAGYDEDRDRNGLRCTLETVRNVLGGIPIHHYISVNMDGLAYLVDAIGGFEYRVKENIYDKSGTRLLLRKGTHYFDGEAFVLFVRHRDGKTGEDWGRAHRQFDILDDLFEDIRDRGLLKSVPTLFKVYRDYIETDLHLKQVAALAYWARNFDPTHDMFYVLDGINDTKDGIWYWVINQAKRVELIRQVFGITVAAWPQDVLRDTPPPPLSEFGYEIIYDIKTGLPMVELFWEPGDGKKVHYELFRDGELLLETTRDELVTEYCDTDVEEGQTYTYTIVVHHYRAEGEPQKLTVYIPFPMVPDVTGWTLDEAINELEGAGYEVVERRENHPTLPEGAPIRTEPAAGTEWKRGELVYLIVSTGKKEVPDVRGSSIEDAIKALKEKGFEISDDIISDHEDDGVEVGRVTRTDPAKGTEYNNNEKVTVTLYVYTPDGEEDDS